MNPISLRLTATVSLALLAIPAAAQENDIDKVRASTTKLIGLLIEQGVLTRDKAEALLVDVGKPAAAPAASSGSSANLSKPSATPTVRVPYLPDFVRKEIKDEVRAELAAQAAREGWAAPGSVPEWTRGITIDGDLRTRYQLDKYASDNAPAVSVTETNRTRARTDLNTTEDRHRLRVRARLGATAVADANWSAGVRLTTGSSGDPISSNQTLGNYGSRYTAAFDRAYIRYRSGDEFNLVAGRFGNPWFSTDLLWANDLGFDGVAAQWTPSLASTVRGFVTLAAMPVQEVELSKSDKWLFGAQLGATLAGSPQKMGGKIGLGYFRYTGIEGRLSSPGKTENEFTAPQFAQKGNTYYNISSDPNKVLLALASQYNLVNLTGQIDFPVSSRNRAVITGDFVRNVGFKSAAASERLNFPVEAQTQAYHLRAAFGTNEIKARHDWQVFMAYKRIERDSMLDAFTDGDFHLGGTDAKGYILGGSYGLGKNAAASVRVFSGDSISGPPLSIDTLQLDLNLRF
jgi:Putative porin